MKLPFKLIFFIVLIILIISGTVLLTTPSSSYTCSQGSNITSWQNSTIPLKPLVKVDVQTFDLPTFLDDHFMKGKYETQEFQLSNLKVTMAQRKDAGDCRDDFEFRKDWTPLLIVQDKQSGRLKNFYTAQTKEGNLSELSGAELAHFKGKNTTQLVVNVHDPGGCGPGFGYGFTVFDEVDGHLVPYATAPKSLGKGSQTTFTDELTGASYGVPLLGGYYNGSGIADIADLNGDGKEELLYAHFHRGENPSYSQDKPAGEGNGYWDDAYSTYELHVYPMDGVNSCIPSWWNHGKPAFVKGSESQEVLPQVETFKKKLTL